MKKKSFFTRLTAIAVSLFTAFSFLSEPISAFADSLGTTKNTQHELNDWGYDFSGSGLPAAYNPITQKSDIKDFSSSWNNDFPYWVDSKGNYSYCVQLNEQHVDSQVMDELEFKNATVKKYYPDDTQRENLWHATIYVYKGKSKYGYSKAQEIVASQCIVWAISGKYFDSSTLALGSNETKLLNCIKAPSAEAKSGMIDCYKKMKEDILTHTDISTGTGASEERAKTYTLVYNATTGKWETTIQGDSTLKQFVVEKII